MFCFVFGWDAGLNDQVCLLFRGNFDLIQYRIYLGGYYSTSSAIEPLSSAIVPPFLPKSWIFGNVKISKIKKYKMQSGSERIFQKFLL